jgi:hypothetical protein
VESGSERQCRSFAFLLQQGSNRPHQFIKETRINMVNGGNKNENIPTACTSVEKIDKHFEFKQSITGTENHLQLKSSSDQSTIMHGYHTISTSNSESFILLNGFPKFTNICFI